MSPSLLEHPILACRCIERCLARIVKEQAVLTSVDKNPVRGIDAGVDLRDICRSLVKDWWLVTAIFCKPSVLNIYPLIITRHSGKM